MRNAENASEGRELTQDELMSATGGGIVTNLVRGAAIRAWFRLQPLPAPGNGDCGPNHNGV
jgi:hypothetical protein